MKRYYTPLSPSVFHLRPCGEEARQRQGEREGEGGGGRGRERNVSSSLRNTPLPCQALRIKFAEGIRLTKALSSMNEEHADEVLINSSKYKVAAKDTAAGSTQCMQTHMYNMSCTQPCARHAALFGGVRGGSRDAGLRLGVIAARR